MSLFGSIQLASNALRANQIGLQVVGQNIANANTPGYVREEVILSPAPTQRVGGLLLGLGVNVEGVVQVIDHFLEDRLRNATSDRVSSESQQDTLQQLESIIGELGDSDLSTSMDEFIAGIHEVLNQPESLAVRNITVLKGKALADDIRRLAERVGEVRANTNDRVIQLADDANRLIEEIRTLNLRISETEAGDTTLSDAVGLRDQRHLALTNLAQLIDIRVEEQPSGGVAIFVGGDFLVFEGQTRTLDVNLTTDRGLSVAEVQIAETQSPLEVRAGQLTGLVAARDDILGGFLDDLDNFAGSLAFEFNKIYSSGQGLTGFSEVTSDAFVDDAAVPLDAAGLSFTPVNGSFQVQVFNERTGLTRSTNIRVDLNGLDADTSLVDLAAEIDAVDGVSATVSTTGHLTVTSDGADQRVAFANDSSGVLAALGINTFFTGSTARGINVNATVLDDPGKFAASRAGVREDSSNAVELGSFLDRPLEGAGGATIADLYDRMVGGVTEASAVAKSVTQGLQAFEGTLQSQSLATSGVSLDEEAIKMISYQRAYQATARYIATLSELMDVLVNL